MDSVSQKVCTKCGILRPLDQFHKRTGTRDGHAYMCRICQAAYDRTPESMQANRDSLNDRYRNDPEFREDRKERHRTRYQNNEEYRERSKTITAIWQRENKDKVNENARRRYVTHYGAKDRARRKTRDYLDRRKGWEKKRLENPEAKRRQSWVLRQSKYRRRALIAVSLEHFTEQEWRDLCIKYNHRCLACGLQVALTADHVIPLARGGSNGIDNIQPLCKSCNSRKRIDIVDYRY